MTRDAWISRLIAAADRLIARGREDEALPLLALAHEMIEADGDESN
jgi:hypothetical protein